MSLFMHQLHQGTLFLSNKYSEKNVNEESYLENLYEAIQVGKS